MKRWFLLGIAVCLFAALTGCNEEADNPSMYIEPAQLTEEEENITALLGVDTEYYMFDFALDGKAQSLQINTYALSNGEWNLISGGGGQSFTDAEGRIVLGFDKIAEGVRIAVQDSEGVGGSASYACEPADNFDGMGCAASFLSNRTEIVYEQEIPLAVQIITAKNRINSYTVEYFNSPEEYAGYEHVYAITARFSQKTVSELSSSNKPPQM